MKGKHITYTTKPGEKNKEGLVQDKVRVYDDMGSSINHTKLIDRYLVSDTKGLISMVDPLSIISVRTHYLSEDPED